MTSKIYFRGRRTLSGHPEIVLLTFHLSPSFPSHSETEPTGQITEQNNLLKTITAMSSISPMLICRLVMLHAKEWFNRKLAYACIPPRGQKASTSARYCLLIIVLIPAKRINPRMRICAAKRYGLVFSFFILKLGKPQAKSPAIARDSSC